MQRGTRSVIAVLARARFVDTTMPDAGELERDGAGFEGHDAVLFEEGFRGAPGFESLTDSLREARVAVRANSMLALVEAVANGLGVGAPACCLGDADPRLRRVFPDLPAQRADLWLVVHADVQRTGRVRALIGALGEAAAVLRG